MIRVRVRGSYAKMERFLELSRDSKFKELLDSCGLEGISALEGSTPRDSGLTANSWGCDKVFTRNGLKLIWTNENLVDGVPVAILIQYGHATRNGTLVEGLDFINPVMRPIFEKIADQIWKEVINR